MTRSTAFSRAGRAGLVVGSAVLGAAMLLGAVAGPAVAAEAPAQIALGPNTPDEGEARFETLPGFGPIAGSGPSRPAMAGSMAWRQTRDPWLAAGLTLAAPLALALPAAAGVWLPAAASPLALATGQLYVGDAKRGALVGLGGMGALAGGAAAGFGAGTLLGAPLQGAAMLGGSLGLGAYAGWAAVDAFQAAGKAGRLDILTVSQK